MLKINIIIPSINLSGGIRVIFLYANYLVSQGHDVICYFPLKLFNLSKLIIIKRSIKTFLKGPKKINWLKCNFKIITIYDIKDKNIRDADITISTLWSTAYGVDKLNSTKGKKVHFIQGYEVWDGPKNLVEDAYRLKNKKIVISKNIQQLLKDKFNVDSSVIYNGLDSNEFISSEKHQNEKIRILMLYHKGKHKRSIEGIDIMKKLKKELDVEVILFGVSKDENVPRDFTFYENPSRSDLIGLYRKSDIYFFTSKEEAWGLPVMEAMSNKCAVVGANVGCVLELCTNLKNVVLCENLDYKTVRDNINYLMNNRDKLIEIQNNGYNLVGRFKWERSFEAFEKYLLELPISYNKDEE
mgnify:CR=1 FL=1